MNFPALEESGPPLLHGNANLLGLRLFQYPHVNFYHLPSGFGFVAEQNCFVLVPKGNRLLRPFNKKLDKLLATSDSTLGGRYPLVSGLRKRDRTCQEILSRICVPVHKTPFLIKRTPATRILDSNPGLLPA